MPAMTLGQEIALQRAISGDAYRYRNTLTLKEEELLNLFTSMLAPEAYEREYERLFAGSPAPLPVKLPVEYDMGYNRLRENVYAVITLRGAPSWDAMVVGYMRRKEPWLPVGDVLDNYYFGGSFPEDIRKEYIRYHVPAAEVFASIVTNLPEFKFPSFGEMVCPKITKNIRRVKDVIMRVRG